MSKNQNRRGRTVASKTHQFSCGVKESKNTNYRRLNEDGRPSFNRPEPVFVSATLPLLEARLAAIKAGGNTL